MLHKNEILFSLWNGIPRCLTLFSRIVFKIISFLMLKKVSFSEKIWLLKSVRYIDDGWLVINFANAAGLYPHVIHSVGLCCVKILHNSINIGVALNTF